MKRTRRCNDTRTEIRATDMGEEDREMTRHKGGNQGKGMKRTNRGNETRAGMRARTDN